MAKRRGQAVVVLVGLILVGIGLLARPAPALAQGEPMSFRLAKLEARNCGGKCPRVIVADGIIEEDTPEAFVGFLQSVADAPNLRDVVVINSPGGRVVASMRLGAALRKLQAAVIVARFGDENDDLNSPSGGQCMSACVYALMGGARRVVPPASRLGIHRMSSQESGGGVGRFFAPGSPSYASPDMVDALAGYAAQMGVSPTVIRVAERIPPEEIHIISPSELRRWRLASPKF
jgi:hypothetical protein